MPTLQQQLANKIYEILPHKKELSFGCKILYSTLSGYPQSEIVLTGLHLIKDNKLFLPVGFDGEMCIGKIDEVIGQPLRLAELLLAIDKELHNEVGIEFLSGCLSFSHKEYGYAKYNISNDNILSQSDEFCEFCLGLLEIKK